MPAIAKSAWSKIPTTERRKTLVRKLRSLKAVDSATARSTSDMAEKLGCDKTDVYGLVCGTTGKACSSPTCLATTGHVKIFKREGEGLVVHLTKRGVSTDFTDAPFAKSVSTKPAKVVKEKVKPKAKVKVAKKKPAKTIVEANGVQEVEVAAAAE